MGDRMKRKPLLLVLVPAVVIGAVIMVTYLALYATHSTTHDEVRSNVESYTPGYMGEGNFSIDSMSRFARYIVIGTIADTTSQSYQIRDKVEEYHNGIVVNIDSELTGTYNNDKRIYFVGPSTNWVKLGDKVLVFLADKEPDSVWGNNYYIIGGLYGLFKVINGKVYGEILLEGLPLDDAIKIIEEARANRVKDISLNAKYIVIGRISDIVREGQYSDTHIKVDVEKELTDNYDGERITLLVDEKVLKHWGEGRVGERYLFFVRDDSKRGDDDNSDGSSNTNYSVGKSGVYYINDDGIARGREFPEGISIDELKAKIIKFRRGE